MLISIRVRLLGRLLVRRASSVMPIRSGLGKSRYGHDAESDDEKTFDGYSNGNPSVITQSRTGRCGSGRGSAENWI
jgi:hypothetical protein